jgi:hypothetical protein
LAYAEEEPIQLPRQPVCLPCPLKSQCCPNTANRRIVRSPHEPARDVARALATTDAYRQSRKDRKKVEMLFAHLKRILKLDRLRLRGLNGAQDEFLPAATAQNLRRMVKWLAPRFPNHRRSPRSVQESEQTEEIQIVETQKQK